MDINIYQSPSVENEITTRRAYSRFRHAATGSEKWSRKPLEMRHSFAPGAPALSRRTGARLESRKVAENGAQAAEIIDLSTYGI